MDFKQGPPLPGTNSPHPSSCLPFSVGQGSTTPPGNGEMLLAQLLSAPHHSSTPIFEERCFASGQDGRGWLSAGHAERPWGTKVLRPGARMGGTCNPPSFSSSQGSPPSGQAHLRQCWICSVLYISFANAGMIQSEIGLLPIQKAPHTRLSCFSYPFSRFNKIGHTNTKPSFIVSPCSCNNLSGSLLLIKGGGAARGRGGA